MVVHPKIEWQAIFFDLSVRRIRCMFCFIDFSDPKRDIEAIEMNTTIDQWEVLEAVVQLGSFAAAAAKMNRSQSTISYAISRLQDQFKIPLLKMTGRKAELTEAGKALLADAEPLLAGFQ